MFPPVDTYIKGEIVRKFVILINIRGVVGNWYEN